MGGIHGYKVHDVTEQQIRNEARHQTIKIKLRKSCTECQHKTKNGKIIYTK